MRFKPPQKAKRDLNEPEIVGVFRAHGISVAIADKPVDLILGYGGATFLVEVKNGPKAPLTKSQIDFFRDWKGQAVIVENVEQAQAFAKAIRANNCLPMIGVNASKNEAGPKALPTPTTPDREPSYYQRITTLISYNGRAPSAQEEHGSNWRSIGDAARDLARKAEGDA